MRTLSSTLNAYQKRGTLRPLVKVELPSPGGGSTWPYTWDFLWTNVGTPFAGTLIWDIEHKEAPWSHTVVVTLENKDKSLMTQDFKGKTMVLSWGLMTSAGGEYSAAAPLTVIDQKFVSTRGGLQCILTGWGIPNLLAQDRAGATYAPTSTDTATVRTLLSAILGATLAPFTHCTAVQVVYDSEDSLINTFMPKDTFRVYKNGSRLAAIRRLIDYTGCTIRWGADGAAHVFVPATTGAVYDYEYALASGSHTFFEKAYQQRLVIPNKVTVESQADDSPAYAGSATDAASFALLPKQDFRQMRLTSNAQATSIAEAMILKEQLMAEGGSGSVPMNVGAEVYDYVQIADARAGDTRTGNIGYVNRRYSVDAHKWEMTFGFGGWANYRDLLNEIETNTDLGQTFARLYAKDAYIENLTADQIDLTSVTQDDIGDGTTYERVLATQLTAGKILLSDAMEYAAGYNPSTKMAGDADLDDIPDGASYKRLLSTQISAGKIYLSDQATYQSGYDPTGKLAVGTTLDSIGEGATYGRVRNTQISSGEIVLTSTSYRVDKNGVIGGSVSGTRVELTADGLRGYNGSTLQVSVSAVDGKVYAAGGNLIIDAVGLTLRGTGTGSGLLIIQNSSGATKGTIYAETEFILAASGAVNMRLAVASAFAYFDGLLDMDYHSSARLKLPVGTNQY